MFTLTCEETVIELPNPVFGDGTRLNTAQQTNLTRNGEINVVRPAIWTQPISHTYNFVTLTKAKKEELLSFLEESAGIGIDVEDHNGDEFSGYIITNANEIVTQKDDCSYDVSLEIEEV